MAKSITDVTKLATGTAQILQAASDVLNRSFTKVKTFYSGREAQYTDDQIDSFEALTSRFARLCDFMFQRVMRVLDQIELVDEGTAIDRLNRCEKRGIVSSVNVWRELRELRNNAAHEYLIEGSDLILEHVLTLTPELLDTVTRCLRYMKNKNYL